MKPGSVDDTPFNMPMNQLGFAPRYCSRQLPSMFRLRKLLVIGVVAFPLAACSSHMYYAEAQVYGAAITEELIRQGMCSKKQECDSNQMVLWEGGGWKIGPLRGGGVSIEVFRVADAAVAKALVERCREVHSVSPNAPVSIVVHSNAHIDNLHPGTPQVILKGKFP